MKVLFCGDIVGRSGREAVLKRVPELRRRLDLDFVFANGENAAGGFGITAAIAREFYDCGVDCLTTGNHVWDQREIIAHIGGDPRLLRPLNYPKATPGKGIGTYTARNGKPVVVINVMTRLFMDPLDDPFQALETALAQHRLGPTAAAAILIDLHGEATSEKQALAYTVDGRASLVVGSHSHVPTADARIMPGGTGYQTDAGMCGDYDSIIGMKKDIATQRFVRKMPGERLTPAEGEGTLCAIYAEIDDASGLARRVAPVRLGGQLVEAMP
ncbi:MAG: YmdB family metallophosphoesterase [Alphaproteobacteria bacterium]|nr:YmdB family metallophosphoesterase [Alphaproteobacteria bacterium]